MTGLVAQQQCVGPLQLPLADVGVVAQSHFTTRGIASACGEQPIKGLVSPSAMGRMVVAEMLTNLIWAKLSALEHVKASGNWMWAAKLSGEGPRMWDACTALKDAMLAVGVGIDGGKDSLSMAAAVDEEVVRAPGMLTLTAYCTCEDVTLTVTPDLKMPGQSQLIFIDLQPSLPGGTASGRRLGGTALAQVFGQLGDSCPDMDFPGGDWTPFVAAFNAVQNLIGGRHVLAGHDRSDGGLLVAVLEMAFAGNCGGWCPVLPPPCLDSSREDHSLSFVICLPFALV